MTSRCGCSKRWNSHIRESEGFRFDKDKDWYLTEEGCAANPVCAHEVNTTGIKIKIQVSMRERPILPVQDAIQIEQSYFKFSWLSLPLRFQALRLKK